MTNNASKIFHIKSYDGNVVIYVGNENSLHISHIGIMEENWI